MHSLTLFSQTAQPNCHRCTHHDYLWQLWLLLWSWSLPDEAEMHTQGAVDARAVDAQEHAIWDTRPAGVFSGTIKTYLHTNRASISCNNFNEISVANIRVLITLFCSITTTMTCDIFSIIYTVNAYHDFQKPKDTNSNTRFNNKDRRGASQTPSWARKCRNFHEVSAPTIIAMKGCRYTCLKLYKTHSLVMCHLCMTLHLQV